MSVTSDAVAAEARSRAEGAASPEGGAGSPWQPKILAFCCNWCTYAGADLAGLNRMNYPADIRLLRVPCSGRVNPQHVLRALQDGCDGVLVCGCHPGDCHYVSGNYYAKRRMMVFKRLLEYSGLRPGRFQVRWISGSEAGKFRDTVVSVTEQISQMGPMASDAPSLEALAGADALLEAARGAGDAR
ncbi:MAG: hydrogenase iron-sulfur subunit [Coriobacteriales bacterium]|jgi:F420-non-reducing hydrogenase iron-sulfur subunit